MYRIRHRLRSLGLGLLATTAMLGLPKLAHATGDAGTKFNIFVPPNNSHTSRRVFIIVTNVSPVDATVDVVDDATDGDSDDSQLGVTLAPGQSQVVRIADGAVNDDLGGKKDGDYFKVSSDHPVVVQTFTKSNWQHDWVPANGGGSRGKSFYVYAPGTSGSDNDINVFAFEDNTKVTVRKISTGTTTATGTTSIDIQNSEVVLERTLHQGEDLIIRENFLGADILDPGHTYWVQATNDVSVQYGHLIGVNSYAHARDGAGFVPSVNGSSTGSLYYFAIPHNPGRANEKELRVSCFDDGTTITLEGTTAESNEWTVIDTALVDAGGHVDYTGASDSAFKEQDLYRLSVSPAYYRCTVFEGNWMETGSFGTSDFASAVSSAGGRNVGYQFMAYVGPPGKQENVAHPVGEQTNDSDPSGGFASHLYVYAYTDNTQVTVKDVDDDGAVFSHTFEIDADEYYDVVIDSATYTAASSGDNRPYFEVAADEPVMVMNGNFNDNWMAYFHSLDPASMKAEVAVDDVDLGCSETATVTVTCENEGGAAITGATATVELPDHVALVGSTGVPSDPVVSGSTWTWDLGSLSAGNSDVLSADIQFTCPAGNTYSQLAPITAECTGTYAGDDVAALDTQNVDLEGSAVTIVTEFTAKDDPDYDGDPADPHVDITFKIIGGVPEDSTVVLKRAENDADGDASMTTLTTVADSYTDTEATYTFKDDYAQHYQKVRYYRLYITDGDDEKVVGPIAVTTSSGGSGGEDSGLESNGRLAQLIARRTVARSERSGWLLPETLAAAEAKQQHTQTRSGDLAQMLPIEGPEGSEAVETTPADLPGFTNANSVYAVDYVDDQGERMATVLLVETEGEVYEHSKALCDRAGGSSIDSLDLGLWPDGGGLQTAAFSNDHDSTGEHAVEFKLYETFAGQFEAHSAWLGQHYPEVQEGQRVINVQAWSKQPGLQMYMAEEILNGLELPWPEPAPLPPVYFERAGTMAGQLQADMQWREDYEQPLSMRLTRVLEDGTVDVEDHALDDMVLPADLGRFLDVTVELHKTEAEEGETTLLDSIWLSDGAWAVIDDSMWGGDTVLHDSEVGTCSDVSIEEHGADELTLAGCGRIEADVSEFAGVARHIGGALAPLDLSQHTTMRMWLETDGDLKVCLEDLDKTGAEQPCAIVPATSGYVTIPLTAFQLQGDCSDAEVGDVDLISFTSSEPGAMALEVRDLSFGHGEGHHADDEAIVLECGAPVNPDDPNGPGADELGANAGCSCSADTEGQTGWMGLLMLAGLAGLRRRKA